MPLNDDEDHACWRCEAEVPRLVDDE